MLDSKDPPYERKRILVIEDEADDQEIYGKLLWYNHYDVAFADCGLEGLRLARATHPDLILLDLRLPDVNGTAVAEELKADPSTADIPVVVLTASRAEEYRDWARSQGCAAFLEKPMEPFEVLKEVQRLIGDPPPAPDPQPVQTP
jgi:CheY-like chemotaxis protein